MSLCSVFITLLGFVKDRVFAFLDLLDLLNLDGKCASARQIDPVAARNVDMCKT